jgi:AraC family transcriptional regulator of adaptative response/methylated-DNA-[protein]-cysteine methyltransferase
MELQEQINFNRIADAISFYKENFKQQPSLEEAAAHVHLSPFHFQKMFKEWAGVTPKQFLQYLSIEYAKDILKETKTSLLDAAYCTGLSGTGRLHDLFIKIEGMTPGEFKNGGKALAINYSFAETPFGEMIVASTSKGICHMAFADDGREEAFDELKKSFPNAQFTQLVDTNQQQALFIFTQDWSKLSQIKLHLKGTPFQLKVWDALIKVPVGDLKTYSNIAEAISAPKASRAVGSAIGSNPVAFLIPCHRVIRMSGETGEYHWGSARKSAMIGWEAVRRLKAN